MTAKLCFALRPYSTIAIAEEGFRHPFDVSHMTVSCASCRRHPR